MHKVYLGDSRNMDKIPDGTADLVIFDPPLWDHVRYSDETEQLGNISDYRHYLAEISRVGAECVRVMKEGGVLITTVPDVFVIRGGMISDEVSFHSDLHDTFRELGLKLISTVAVLIGDEKSRDFVPADENLFRRRDDLRTARMIILQTFSKGGYPAHLRAKTVSDYWHNVKRFGSHSTILGSRWLYRLATFILSWKPLRQIARAIRPQKESVTSVPDYPVRASEEMFDWIVTSWTRPGELVLDPFLGTGTSLAVCERTQRRCIGYEINPAAYPVIAKSVGDVNKVEFIGWSNPDIQ